VHRAQGLPLTETSNHFQAQATIDGVVQARLLALRLGAATRQRSGNFNRMKPYETTFGWSGRTMAR
jgi:hypothetical protein